MSVEAELRPPFSAAPAMADGGGNSRSVGFESGADITRRPEVPKHASQAPTPNRHEN